MGSSSDEYAGEGVGSNYSNRYMQSLPPILQVYRLPRRLPSDHQKHCRVQDLLCKVTQSDVGSHSDVLKVPDTRGGGLKTVEHILKAAWDGSSSGGVRLSSSMSQVSERVASSSKTSGGIAWSRSSRLNAPLTSPKRSMAASVELYLRHAMVL